MALLGVLWSVCVVASLQNIHGHEGMKICQKPVFPIEFAIKENNGDIRD